MTKCIGWLSFSWQVTLSLLLINACQSQPPLFSGEIQNFIRDSLYLFRWEAGRWDKVASAKVEGGKFAFKGAIPPGIYLWGLSPQEGDIVWLDGKETPLLKGEANQLFQTYTYEKSPRNERLVRFRREVSAIYQSLGQSPSTQSPLQARIDSLLQEAEKSGHPILLLYAHLFRMPATPSPAGSTRASWEGLVQAFWKNFPWTHPYAAQLPETFGRFQNFWQNALAFLPEDSVIAYATDWISGMPPSLQRNAWMSLLDAGQRFQRTDVMVYAGERFIQVAPSDPRNPQIQQFIQAEGALRKGQPAPEIALPDPEGKVRRLSELKGKWVLIDFWASWCRPCRMENPNVVRLYEKYHSRGFEILGVSLDQNRDAWLQAIQHDRLTWLHVSDLKGWQSAGAQLYRVSGIPFTVLVDPEGRIAAKGLRGIALEQRLKEIFP
ncbi:MAG: AhpC/TSA family protein [Bacteroidia bacterium]|nr:AhpC/TSA family protein [Bacteroidia bacterium]